MEIEIKQTKTIKMGRKEIEEAITDRLRLMDILTGEDMTISFEHDCFDNVYNECKIKIERYLEQKG